LAMACTSIRQALFLPRQRVRRYWFTSSISAQGKRPPKNDFAEHQEVFHVSSARLTTPRTGSMGLFVERDPV
jgi:hypothetical protein